MPLLSYYGYLLTSSNSRFWAHNNSLNLDKFLICGPVVALCGGASAASILDLLYDVVLCRKSNNRSAYTY